jgi:hypothetical protein
MYTSTFTELVQILNETQKNWVVNIETEESGSETPWQAELSFVDGIVAVCHVWRKADGRSLLTDRKAIHWLTNLPSLRWTLEEPTPQQALPQAFNGSQAVLSSSPQVPQRFRQVEQGVIPPLSRKQRQVFALVDGTRSAERIAAILRQPVEVVVRVLDDLQAMGMITLE